MSTAIQELIAQTKLLEEKTLQPTIAAGSMPIEQLTFGPDENNLGGSYTHGNGVWDIKFLDKLSPDIWMLYLSRAAQMYRQTNQPNLTTPLPRGAKDLILKERYPVHQLS